MTLLGILLSLFAAAAILIGARALTDYLDKCMGYQPKRNTAANEAAKPTTNNRAFQ